MKIAVKLTLPQWRFFEADIEVAKSLGDLKTYGFKLLFDDYEGANATYRRFLCRSSRTTREYVTWNAVIDKVNAAIRKAVAA